jgi:hypothetical protein
MKSFFRIAGFSMLLFSSSCSLDQMESGSRLKPLDSIAVVRPQIPGTIARGQLREDVALWTGKKNGKTLTHFPFPMTVEDVKEGRVRYEIHCSPCHGRTGDGRGMIVERGFTQPPSYFSERLRKTKTGYLFDVISQGFGAMPSYADQIEVHDRWRIVAYIKVLQESRENIP